MGIYYLLANHTKKQYVEPGQVGGGNIKRSGMVFGAVARLAAYLMTSEWYGDHVVFQGDSTEAYEEVRDQYQDVTEQAVQKYLGEYGADDADAEWRSDPMRLRSEP